MKLSFLACLTLLFSSICHAKDSGTVVPLTANSIEFKFEDQDGQISYPCSFSLIEAAQDFKVSCDKWDFTVHARVFKHSHPNSPKLSYELLYWITDHQVPPGDQGKYPGTTLWLNFDEPSDLVSFEVSQDIETTWVLRMNIQLR